MTRAHPMAIAAGSAAVIVLAGCGQVGQSSKTLEKALDAYVAGDRAALTATAEAVAAEKEAATAQAGWDTNCTGDAVAARRLVMTDAFVHGLNQTTVMSMPELARLGNLQALVEGRGKVDFGDLPPEPDCGQRNQIGAVQDVAEKLLMVKMVAERGKAWRAQLEAKYGAQFNPRMKEANRLLGRHGYGSGDSRW
jgi:hypothetical protein